MAKPRALGPEAARSQQRRLAEGFVDRYLSGDHVLDIGYRGGRPDAEPVTAKAIGVELDYPGYDGIRLPFADATQDAVFASHTLEHIEDHRVVLADWFRVLKLGGYLIVAVPHQHLYERKADLPSRFNGDHKRFYTPASLLAEIEAALPVAAYRLRSLRDIDDGFSTKVPPEKHPVGCYEIELVIEKIEPPAYAAQLVLAPQAAKLVAFFGAMLRQAHEARRAGRTHWLAETQLILASLPLPPFRQLQRHLPDAVSLQELREVMRPLIHGAPFDEAFYITSYPDIGAAVQAGAIASGHDHFVNSGYYEGRYINTTSPLFG